MSCQSAVGHIASTINDFIEKLQFIWAVNAANGVVVLQGGSRLAREIELELCRTMSATLSPGLIWDRINLELHPFNDVATRNANPLFHGILLYCRGSLVHWHETNLWSQLQPIAQSDRDVEEMENRRCHVPYSRQTPRDVARLQRMQHNMYADHFFRMRLDGYMRALEIQISAFAVPAPALVPALALAPAEGSNAADGNLGGEMEDKDVEMGEGSSDQTN